MLQMHSLILVRQVLFLNAISLQLCVLQITAFTKLLFSKFLCFVKAFNFHFISAKHLATKKAAEKVLLKHPHFCHFLRKGNNTYNLPL